MSVGVLPEMAAGRVRLSGVAVLAALEKGSTCAPVEVTSFSA